MLLEKIAEIKNISVEEVAETTTENFFSLFSKCQDQLTLLGVGASAGTPVVGCECSTCKSTNKKNYRTRCSSLLTLKNGKNILIDTSPDLRLQSLREGLTSD